jgi:hypothetical protein
MIVTEARLKAFARNATKLADHYFRNGVDPKIALPAISGSR